MVIKDKLIRIPKCCKGCWFADHPSKICRSCKHFEEANDYWNFDIEDLEDDYEVIE